MKRYAEKEQNVLFESQVIVTLEEIAVHIVTSINVNQVKKVFEDSIDDFMINIVGPRSNDEILTKILGNQGYKMTCWSCHSKGMSEL